MMYRRPRPLSSWLGIALALCLLAAGAALGIAGWRSHGVPPPPVPPRSADVRTHVAALAPLPFSVPVGVIIPAIGVRAQVIPLGETPQGTVEVPLLTMAYLVSWFDKGPTPGQRGPAALFGHVDSVYSGPAVFYKLGDLRPGDTVSVIRADHETAVFTIDRVAIFPKTAFPTMAVYGSTPDPQLRLVTCGGPFDLSTRTYLDNIVAFATLTGVQR
jgi:sortase (surface protein transpeptidase)